MMAFLSFHLFGLCWREERWSARGWQNL